MVQLLEVSLPPFGNGELALRDHLLLVRGAVDVSEHPERNREVRMLHPAQQVGQRWLI